jgi:nucleotide-binding universal stress UspA family protein
MILIAYDGSPDSRAAIERAAKLEPGEKTTILVVWEPFVEVMTRSGAGLGLAPGIVDFDEIDKANEEAARKRAQEGVEYANSLGLDAEPRVRAQETTISRAILVEAKEVDARAIVMGTRGLTGVKSLLLGSVSHGVLQHADWPVIVVPSPEVVKARAEQLD